jgi:hypothetical protein
MERDGNRSPHHFQQNLNVPGVVKPLEAAHEIGERAGRADP